MLPVVSVIIPNYNHAPYLEERIESILHQTWQDFEIIILDDCSTDNSKEVIENYRSNNKVSKIIYNEKNTGVAFLQWQKGIEAASGDWVWIAESDDWCEANLLETLMRGISSNTVLAVAQSVVVSNDGKIRWKSEAAYLDKTYTGTDFIKNRMLLDNFGIPNASMCIFKRSEYAKVNKEFTSYKFCGDWLFWISIASFGDVYISGKYLNYFRKHDKDVSGSAYKNGLHYKEYFKLLDTLLERQIITEEEKQNLLIGKLKMFLKDKRLETNTRHEVKNKFRLLINGNYFPTVAKYKLVTFIKQLKGSG